MFLYRERKTVFMINPPFVATYHMELIKTTTNLIVAAVVHFTYCNTYQMEKGIVIFTFNNIPLFRYLQAKHTSIEVNSFNFYRHMTETGFTLSSLTVSEL